MRVRSAIVGGVLALAVTLVGCEDETGNTDDAGLDLSARIACPKGQIDCGECVDPTLDRRHCGGCGLACREGEQCAAGACSLSCEPGRTICIVDGGGSQCTALKTDRTSCGSCGIVCAPGFVCADGQCALSCPSTLTTCPGVAGAEPVCTSLASDPSHCGACDHACTVGTHPACTAGLCAPCADGSCRVVFVTSTSYSGQLGGLPGADTRCQQRALAAGLTGVYRAWLSASTISASERLTHAVVPYLRTDGATVANDWTDLTSGSIRAFIDRTELGLPLASGTTKVYTGTRGDGFAVSILQPDAGASPTCGDWTDGSVSTLGRTGILDDLDDEWTDAAFSPCDTQGALYCVQQ